MHTTRRTFSAFFALTALAACVSLSGGASALEAGKDGWYHTGDAMRVKTIGFINVKVYAIGHDIKALPAQHTKQAIIDADVDKRITWQMQRDVDQEKIKNALREAYAMNNYTDAAKINQALGAFTAELKEKAYVTIIYNAAAKTTTIWEQNGGTVTVPSVEFMKGTWSIWFGKIDPPSLGDSLISNWK